MKEWQEYDYMGYCDGNIGINFDIWSQNGGYKTFQELLIEEFRMSWVREIEKLPTHLEYINTEGQLILMSHAGFSPYATEDGNDIVFPTDHNLLWGRSHLNDTMFDYRCDNCISVFGHTPIQTINKSAAPGALYLPGRKINIDNGAFFTGQYCLLDLDTFR